MTNLVPDYSGVDLTGHPVEEYPCYECSVRNLCYTACATLTHFEEQEELSAPEDHSQDAAYERDIEARLWDVTHDLTLEFIELQDKSPEYSEPEEPDCDHEFIFSDADPVLRCELCGFVKPYLEVVLSPDKATLF
jgi:hypothetical protein